MSPKAPVRIIFGTHTMGSTTERPGICHFDSPEDVKALLTTLWNRGYRELDTAANYPGAEERIGAVIAASKASSSSSSSFSPEPEAKAEPLTFTLHTKVADGLPGSHTAAKLAASIAQSLAELRVEQVETIFLHVPDRETRFEEQVKGMHDAVQAGQARRWGISNYSAEEVKSMIRICEEEGWTKPSVYQGHYNAIVRGGEKELFPLLRENGMEFWAYSPAAGGFFADKKVAGNAERWKDTNQIGALYNNLYSTPMLQTTLTTIRTAARTLSSPISPHAAALRWTAYHSALDTERGDAVVFTVSSIAQLQSSLDAIEDGPLPKELVGEFEGVYELLGGSGPGYCL